MITSVQFFSFSVAQFTVFQLSIPVVQYPVVQSVVVHFSVYSFPFPVVQFPNYKCFASSLIPVPPPPRTSSLPVWGTPNHDPIRTNVSAIRTYKDTYKSLKKNNGNAFLIMYDILIVHLGTAQ